VKKFAHDFYRSRMNEALSTARFRGSRREYLAGNLTIVRDFHPCVTDLSRRDCAIAIAKFDSPLFEQSGRSKHTNAPHQHFPLVISMKFDMIRVDLHC